jgi:N6-adenosine-specific RNA methylase IME4
MTVYSALDIPRSLAPPSFEGLAFIAPVAPDSPRNHPDPKKEGKEWPQASDLMKLHEWYGGMAEEALRAAKRDGVEWYTAQGCRTVAGGEDIRLWQKMFEVMKSFNSGKEYNVINLSTGLVSSVSINIAENEFRIEEIYGEIISNPNDGRAVLKLQDTFYIPAKSSLILDTFPSASNTLTTYTLNASRFDLIILDPPWHNKAVSRLKRKRDISYNTMKDMVTEIPPAGNWLAPGGLIGIWCTNNLTMINKVKNVLFKRWRVELVAEWIWLKVTCKGQPVVDLSSTFRKPYEILLIARKQGDDHVEVPQRKVLIAVPSYHSQKPCLKGTLGTTVSNRRNI